MLPIVLGLAENLRIPVHSGGTANVDDIPRFAILDAEIRCCRSDESERRGVVKRKHRVPLLIGHLRHKLLQSLAQKQLICRTRDRFPKCFAKGMEEWNGFLTLCITPSQVKPASDHQVSHIFISSSHPQLHMNHC